jgi:hypothetical protein
MFLLWFFGLMDLSTILFLLGTFYDIVGWRLGFAHLSYLVFKGFYFWGDMASMIDLCIAILFFLMLFGFRSELLLWVSALYLLQKSVFSLKALMR